MADPFANLPASAALGAATRHFTITKSDSADLATIPRAIRCDSAGTLTLRDGAGTDITYTVQAGELIQFAAVRVLSTGTTATGIVGWY